MTDVSPKLNSPDGPDTRSPESNSDILSTANALQEAVGTLANAIVGGSGIQRAETRDRFEIALAAFSQAIDQTEE